METLLTAIVLKSSDVNESDKIVTLFSPESGKSSAILKGVKKEKAKLKFAAEPFCFGKFELTGAGAVKTVTGCEQIEPFFEITKDLTKFYCGCAALEFAYHTAQENEENPGLFIVVLKTLQQLCLNDVAPEIVLIKFVLDAFGALGQRLCFDKCAACGEQAVWFYFDFDSGGAICPACAKQNFYTPDAAAMSILKIVSDLNFDKLRFYKCNGALIKNALIFLNGVLANHVHKIKSLKELIEL